MGELGATVMVYPPGWVTLTVSIFNLTDRGDIFADAALTMILVAATLVLLLGLERITTRHRLIDIAVNFSPAPACVRRCRCGRPPAPRRRAG